MVKNVKNKIKNFYKLEHGSGRYVEAMMIRWLENLSLKKWYYTATEEKVETYSGLHTCES